MRRALLSLALLCLPMAAQAADVQPMAAQAADVHPRLRETLRTARPTDLVPIIIEHADRVDVDSLSKGAPASKRETRRKVRQALQDRADLNLLPIERFLEANGARSVKRLWITNGVAATVPAGLVEMIARMPGVGKVRLDAAVTAADPSSGPVPSPEWNLNAIHAPAVWSLGWTGANITIGILDTGADAAHPDLKPRWRGGAGGWFDPYGQHSSPYDQSGHGTAVTSIAVGGNASGTHVGVAPGAKWIAARVFDDSGSGRLSAIHQAFQWMLDPDRNATTDDEPDVVNASWNLAGTLNLCDAEFQPDLKALRAAEIAVVFAAGNDGPTEGTSASPGNLPEAFAVGAVDVADSVAAFSSRGPSACTGVPYPAVAAPGVNVQAADLSYGGLFPNSYTTISGTTAAAPHVAGAMALLLSAWPDMKVADLQTLLQTTALDVDAIGADTASGSGVIDVKAAYDLRLKSGPPTAGTITEPPPVVVPPITISKVAWNASRRQLTVEATSKLGKLAKLQLVGSGPMTWNATRKLWTITVRLASKPASVTVSGVEGSVTVSTADYGV